MSGPSTAYNVATVLTGSARLAANAVMQAIVSMNLDTVAGDELVNRTIRVSIEMLCPVKGAFHPDGPAQLHRDTAAARWRTRGTCRSSASGRLNRN